MNRLAVTEDKVLRALNTLQRQNDTRRANPLSINRLFDSDECKSDRRFWIFQSFPGN
jgi:hypothetical protein